MFVPVRKETTALNSSFIGSSGDIGSEQQISEEAPLASSELSDEEELPLEDAGSRRNEHGERKPAEKTPRDQRMSRAVSPKPLKGSAGKWRENWEKKPAEYRAEIKALTDKLTVSSSVWLISIKYTVH